jgi:hypothetical protein
VTSSRAFWFVLGVAGYWAFQHFTGMGNTGKATS